MTNNGCFTVAISAADRAARAVQLSAKVAPSSPHRSLGGTRALELDIPMTRPTELASRAVVRAPSRSAWLSASTT